MSRLVTQCPRCRTAFRVAQHQIAAAEGLVRCGSCANVFTAEQHRLGSDPPEQTGTPSHLDISQTYVEGLFQAQSEEAPRPPVVTPAYYPTLPTQAVDQPWSITAPRTVAPEPLSLPAAASDAETPAFQLLATTAAAAEAETATATAIEAETEVVAGASAGIATEAETAAVIEEPLQFVLSATPAVADGQLPPASATIAASDPTVPTVDAAVVVGEPGIAAIEAASADTQPSAPFFDPMPIEIEMHRPRRRRLRDYLWVAASCVALVTLSAQYAWFNRATLALDLRWRPLYESVCAIVVCELPPLRDFSQLRSDSLVIRAAPNLPGVLIADAIITNYAAFAQPCPDLAMEFSDAQGHVIAHRNFRPVEYLDASRTAGAMLASHEPVRVHLELMDPGEQATNYRIELREPH